MDERPPLLPTVETISSPLQAMAAAATEAEGAFASLDAVVAAGGAVLERTEGTVSRVAALLAGSGSEAVDGAGSLAATLENTSTAADRLLDRLAGLITTVERATDPGPWRELRSEVEATVESLGRMPGMGAGKVIPAGGAASDHPTAGRDGALWQSPNFHVALGSNRAEADSTEATLPSSFDSPLQHATVPTITPIQSESPIPAYSLPAVSVTLQTPPLGAEYWHSLFRTPGFEEALRQFLAEWAYQQSQQANPGPGY